MLQRYLDPKVLSSISGLELTAKTVVDGFISGLHRSPDFGFSQEFAEYRPYTPGDDLRYVDWNVYARSGRAFLKRYRGETNTRLTILMDRSASMSFGSGPVHKMDYARYLAASLAYLGSQQRDAIGLIAFDDDVRDVVPPSSRQGQLMRVLHAIDRAEPGLRTDYDKPFRKFMESVRWRGVVVLISDFYAKPEDIVKTVAPLRFRGNDVLLMHVLDRQELEPRLGESRLFVDMETGDTLEVSPEYAEGAYRKRLEDHLESLKSKVQGAGLSYFLLPTDRPLDEALREYLVIKIGRAHV